MTIQPKARIVGVFEHWLLQALNKSGWPFTWIRGLGCRSRWHDAASQLRSSASTHEVLTDSERLLQRKIPDLKDVYVV